MKDITELLSLNNNVFRAYLFYSSILIFKMILMIPLTARLRYSKKIFSSPEDAKTLKGAKAGILDPDIERVRRAHLNDMENIYLFFAAAFGYVLTNPTPALAILLMRIFTIARIAHTFVYAVVVIPQPARAIAFIVGLAITVYMAFMTITTFAT